MDERERLRLDVESLKRRVADVKRSEERFRAALELAPDAILISDAQGRIVLANRQVTVLFGYLPAELEGRTVEILMPERFRQGHERDRARYMEEPRTRSMGVGLDLHGRRKDGSEFPVEIGLSPLRQEDGVHVMAVIRDMTEHREIEARLRAEEATRSSEERFRLLLENASDLLVLLDEERRIRYASPATERILGMPAGDLPGQSLGDRVHPDDRSRFEGMVSDSLRNQGTAAPVELRLRREDDTWRVLDTTASNLLSHPEIHGLVLSLRDVTERKRYEKALLQTQKMESIGRLAGGVAHDFNNLLTGILSYAEMAREALPVEHPAHEYVEVIEQAANQAAALTQQLLVFSRRQPVEPRLVDINEVIREIEKLLRRLIGETVNLETHLTPGLGSVHIDRGQFEQVLVNLAVNARDAMPEGGRLVLQSLHLDVDEREARRQPGLVPGEYLVVEVSDTGVGMDDETKAHLFEPFFTTKEEGKGTGLGLATCYGILSRAGGHITIHSKKGHGTTVRLYLPKAQGEAVELRASPAPGEAPHGTETILVVEDEASLRDLVSKMLSSLGYTVLTAESGERALAVADAHEGRIDLVLTDVVMPGVGGQNLAEILAVRRPSTRFLLMSGYPQGAPVVRAGMQQGLAFLEKPFSARGLARKIRELLDAGPIG